MAVSAIVQKSAGTGTSAENLENRETEPRGPGSILLTGIACIPLNGTFCHLATILGACKKRALEAAFILEAGEAPWGLTEQGDGDPQRPGGPVTSV